MARTVAGTLLLPNGQPLANAKIYFVAKRTEAASILEGVNASFSTNASGVYSQSIVNGYYSVSIEVPGDSSGTNPRRYSLGDAYVETAATTTLEALLIATNPPEDLALGLFYELLAQTQAAAANAQASAAAAANSAASVTPTQSPTDTTPGRLWRTNDLVKTTSSTDTTAGRMLRVGDGGFLGTTPLPPGNDLNTAAGSMASGLYRYESSTGGIPLAGTNGNLIHMRRASGGGEARIAVRDSDSFGIEAFLQGRSTGGWQSWQKIWSGSNLVKESGVFVPTAFGGSTAGVATYTLQSGRYFKIDNRVDFSLIIGWSAHTGAGNLIIGGLPFTSISSAPSSAVTAYHDGLTVGAGKVLAPLITANQSTIPMRICDVAGGAASLLGIDSSVSTLILSGTYFTAS